MNTESKIEDPVLTRSVSPDESFSEAVVEAVATVSGAESVPNGSPESGEALTPLYEVVDPDALDSLFRPAGPEFPRNYGEVTFAYQGYEVTVHSEGRVTVDRTSAASD